MRKTLLLLPILLLLTGCTGVLLPTNDVDTKKAPGESVEITGFQFVSAGTVEDLTKNGKAILSVTQNKDNLGESTIDIYDMETKSLVNMARTTEEVKSARFTKKGLYYLKSFDKSSGKEDLGKLIWVSLDKTEERTITDGDKSCSGAFSVWGDDNVVFVEGDSTITFSSPEKTFRSITVTEDLDIKKIRYSPSTDMVYFTARADGEDETSLYAMEAATAGREALTCLAKNVLDFDYSEAKKEIAFIRDTGNTKGLFTQSTDKRVVRPVNRKNGDFQKCSFTKDGQALIFVLAQAEDTSCSTVWIWEEDQGRLAQLTAPMEIASRVVSRGFESPIFFSTTSDYLTDAAAPNLSVNDIVSLSYQFK